MAGPGEVTMELVNSIGILKAKPTEFANGFRIGEGRDGCQR